MDIVIWLLSPGVRVVLIRTGLTAIKEGNYHERTTLDTFKSYDKNS